MHDRYPLRTVLAVFVPAALLLTVGWLLCGETVYDAVFAMLKLVVTR
ncbi:MAG: hypothetical protein IJZ74_10920 [Clostridia bacterium]|nr:hypothetical protein [Clostridia bacterium]